MLYAFGFERIGVLVGDLYFVNPRPEAGQEGAERGVRLEVRLMEQGPPPGSIYSAIPITAGRPVWRADLLESVAAEPGSLDRAHHHPAFRGWEPGRRCFDPDLSADPLGFVAGRLADLEGLLAGAGLDPSAVGEGDPESLRRAAPEVVGAVARLLAAVKAGQAGLPPARSPDDVGAGTRAGWL